MEPDAAVSQTFSGLLKTGGKSRASNGSVTGSHNQESETGRLKSLRQRVREHIFAAANCRVLTINAINQKTEHTEKKEKK